MSTENTKPPATERLHTLILEEFHNYRRSVVNDSDVFKIEIDGITLGNIIAKAKMRLYSEYPEAKEPTRKAEGWVER